MTFLHKWPNDTIKLLLAIVGQLGWCVHHLDVKSAFLNGYQIEESYVQQTSGFEIAGNEEKVYKLNKALYGLKQTLRAWYSRTNTHFR